MRPITNFTLDTSTSLDGAIEEPGEWSIQARR
jgi:hypothetical protein